MGKVTVDPFEVLFMKNRYDLKSFLKNHPGGVNMLENYKDRSVVAGMKKYDHSTAAYHIMQDYKIKTDDDVKLTNGHANGDIANEKQLTNGTANGKIANGNIQDILNNNEDELEEILKDSNREKENEELMKIEARVDWSKPMLGQLHLIGSDYDRWVNAPVDKHLRLFASPFLESLTFSPWYLVPAFWLPIIIYLLYYQYSQHVLCIDDCREDVDQITNASFICRLAFGALVWTLLEYSIHRWIFHMDPGSSNGRRTFHFLLHGLHHKVPFDTQRLVFPPIPAAVITTLIYYIIIKPCFYYPFIPLTGGIIGYLTYDMIHAYVHGGSPEDGTYLYEMKRYHANHHFANSDKGFGISNKLWDYVFNTKIKLKKLGFSLRW